MIAHRGNRLVVINEVDPFPARASRKIKLPPRAGRPAEVAVVIASGVKPVVER